MPERLEIQRLCGSLERGDIDSTRFLERLTRLIAMHIGCARAGVWFFVDSPQGRALRCAAMYDVHADRLVSVTDMLETDVAPYFAALTRDGSVVAPDARSHAATSCFLDEYLAPLDVRSLMDVCFLVNGRPVGTFSCEQVGATKHWTPAELQSMKQIGSRAGLTLLHAANAYVDTAPGALWEATPLGRLTTLPAPLDLTLGEGEGDDKP